MIFKSTIFIALTCLTGFIGYKTFYKKNFKIKTPLIYTEKDLSKKKAEVILKNFKLQQVNSRENENWILTARHGKIFHFSNQVECEDLNCIFTKKNKTIAKINARKSFVDQDKKMANLLGNVFGNFYELQFNGKNILYNFENHIIQTKNKIIYKHPRFTMVTNNSHADIKKNRITMKNGVETEFYLKDTIQLDKQPQQ